MPPMIGQISLFSFKYAPAGWITCDGSLLPISENDVLFQLVGFTYGGDGTETFGLPNLTQAAPQNLHYCMSLFGVYNTGRANYEAVLGETMLAPPALGAANMMQAAGQSLPTSQYGLLAMYMGTRFGGDAQHFSLPDLRSRAVKNLQYLFAVAGELPDSISQRDPFLAEIMLLPYQKPSQSLLVCDGAQLPIAQYPALHSLIGTTFGGGGTTFKLPDLTSSAPTGYSYYIAVRNAVFPPRP